MIFGLQSGKTDEIEADGCRIHMVAGLSTTMMIGSKATLMIMMVIFLWRSTGPAGLEQNLFIITHIIMVLMALFSIYFRCITTRMYLSMGLYFLFIFGY